MPSSYARQESDPPRNDPARISTDNQTANSVDAHTPSGWMPGSYSNTDPDQDHNHNHNHIHTHHMAVESIFQPPAPSPRPAASRTPSHQRSRTSRNTSSIPRPVARSGEDNESDRKRPRVDAFRPAAQTSSSWNLVRDSAGDEVCCAVVDFTRKRSTSSFRSTPAIPRDGFGPAAQTSGSWNLVRDSAGDQSCFAVVDFTRKRQAISPPPLVNTTYKLAGGLDTPNASYQRRLDEWEDREEELDWRMNRYTNAENSTNASTNWSGETVYDTAVQSQSQLPRTPSLSGHGQKRALENSPRLEASSEFPVRYSATGWHLRSKAWAMTGGLAVKAVNFAWNTAFRGFSAGAGQSYATDLGTPDVTSQGLRVSQIAEQDDVFSHRYEKPDVVPGGFDAVEDYFSSNATSTSAREVFTPTAQGQHDNNPLERGDWYMVDKPSDSISRSAVRRRSRASVAGSRSGSHRSTTGLKNAQGSSTGASFASPRARSVTVSASPRQRAANVCASDGNDLNEAPTRLSLSNVSPDRRRSSYYAKNQSSPTRPKQLQPQSPSVMSPEIAKYEKRMRKRARAEDESMTRMNAHLQDLIRQGKEALGTSISIKDGGYDFDD